MNYLKGRPIVWKPVPKLLEASFFEMPITAQPSKERIVKDYEFNFFVSGNGKIWLDDICYNIAPNTIMINQPGQRCRSEAPYACYVMALDFSGEVHEKYKNGAIYFRQRPGAPQSIIKHECLDLLEPQITPVSAIVYKEIFSKLSNLKKCNATDDEYETVLTEFFLYLLADAVHYINSQIGKNYVVTNRLLDKLVAYLSCNFNEEILLNDMAKIANLSPSYLYKLFQRHFKTTPADYLKQIRLNRAVDLLIGTDNSIEWISEQCGFKNCSYFAANFKKTFKMTPREFRKNFCKGDVKC